MIGVVKIRAFERGLHFRNGELVQVLKEGRHIFGNPFVTETVDIVSIRDVYLTHQMLDVIVKSGKLDGSDCRTLELADNERALVWINKRFSKILGAGQHVLWTNFDEVQIEVVTTDAVRFQHRELYTIDRKSVV